MLSQNRLASRTAIPSVLIVGLIAASVFHVASAQDPPDCQGACHVRASCDLNAAGDASVCSCLPGTITTPGSAAGTSCDINGWSIRYVVDTDPGENPSATTSEADGLAMCVNADGWFVRKIWSYKEVNCLYATEPQDVAAYGDKTPDPSGADYFTLPAIYAWTLPTTKAPLRIPPTGMDVQSVQFNTSCAETGCWVVRGLVTTGAAFGSNGAFNTFFLPQADITAVHPQGDLSYDFNYADVEWTFSPANHPCTSAAFQAGAAGASGSTDKISTCCISNPTVSTTATGGGGFVANYRPTQAFSDWAGELPCDYGFERDGQSLCWKLYHDKVYRQYKNRQNGAKERCEIAGGRLAVIASQEENDAMEDLVGEFIGLDYQTVWIGLMYNGPQGSKNAADRANPALYSWSDGLNYSYGIPDKVVNHLNYNWPQVIFFDSTDGNWEFLQAQNGRQKKFVCEFETPKWEETCIKHSIQRPDLSAPPLEERPCWDVYQNPSATKKSWPQARDQCIADGGDFATIEDAEENHFFHRLLNQHGANSAFLGMWSDSGTTNYTWVDGRDPVGQWPNQPWKKLPDVTTTSKKCSIFAGGVWDVNKACGGHIQAQAYVCEFSREDYPNKVCHSDVLNNDDNDPGWDLPFPTNAGSFMEGKFKDMDASPGVVSFTNLDPFFGQYSFEIQLDEVELRSMAGKLKGTVGVEHTVDTYLGLADFRPTGIAALDTFATQVNLHLEKTSFFTVSTHGTNDYTFLEYVNMRLVSVYDLAEANGADKAAGDAGYVQVTFTMGSQYQPNPLSGGLIPSDSVRAGIGTFVEQSSLEHLCTTSANVGLSSNSGTKTAFEALIAQSCGPQSAMCLSPTSTPDSFVSFNIPLGIDVFDGLESPDLSQNVFVSMVINALDTNPAVGGTAGPTPNEGDDPMQMKTTLTASIPIVAGGINIFCDGLTAKTDLKDVANVDIVVGTAASPAELTRLRILTNIASTDATATGSTIDTDSIESALMTLVIKGNDDYFRDVNTNTGGYSMELEDVITVHLMEDGVATTAATSTKEETLVGLLGETGADALDAGEFALNGAFHFTIVNGAPSLEPTDALLAVCPFNPTRPVAGNSQLESCITRRDVSGRGYPNREGAVDTAVEISHPAVAGGSESQFLATILGDNDFADQLAPNFVAAIDDMYTLNGRYIRAYWINPGYEWTPTQTGGKSLFSVSQKIYLFALISLDENWTRRRMLLQTSTDALQENAAGINSASVAFDVTPKSMMAKAFDVPEDRVALFNLEMQLTPAEACMPPTALQGALRLSLEKMLEDDIITSFKTVQVTSLTVDKGDEQCSPARRNIRKLLAGSSTATATIQMLIVFEEGTASIFDMEKFEQHSDVKSIEAAPRNSPKVAIGPVDCATLNCGMTPSSGSDDSSSSNVPLIAGIVGGVAGALLVAAGVLMFMRSRSDSKQAVAAVQTINVADLKSQLADDV